MTDLGMTIAPKSDQLNSDDLISGPRTIRVTKVSLCSEPDQPIAISFEGDNGKPYKPCKSMRRVLVNVWGRDGNLYAGRTMTLYRDPAVLFGGQAVGGIRISHVSHIDRDVTMALTATRANRKPFTVRPLRIDAPPQVPADANAAAAKGTEAYRQFFAKLSKADRESVMIDHAARKAIAAAADAAATQAPVSDTGLPHPDQEL